jgi:NAD(P)-dependent dehydrogenase (short-subunit alcohol dehydrogenase family)
MNRMGAEGELRTAILYLASKNSAFVTGQNIVVDGGWTIW